MPDQLTDVSASWPAGAHPPGSRSGRGRPGPAFVAGAVVVAYAVVAALAGWLWEWWWTPPAGLVYEGAWGLEGAQLSRDFDGTGRYVLLAFCAGLVLAAILALTLSHHELAVLAGVLVGSCLAAYLMATVGHALGPADPAALAEDAADLSRLPGELRLRGRSPWLAFPLGSLTGVLAVWLGFTRPRSRRA